MEKQLYANIFKWVSWALLIVSVVLLLVAFPKFGGGDAKEEGAVTMLLNWAYVMLGLALVSVLCVGLYVSAVTNPKSLITIGIVIVGAVVVVLVAYLLASGSQPLAYNGPEPSAGELKLTDTVLNLTYGLGIAAILAIIVGEIMGFIRKKA
ncbi:MAG: hypothetical protein II652_04200 [Bacteroidales bacterium]|nr:hypothetical protein [Bacteroidales bacterium]